MSKTVMSRTSGVGARVSGDTGARGARRAARLRGGASVAALLAAGALLAGCGTAAPDTPDREPAPAAAPVADGAAADASGAVKDGDQSADDASADDASADDSTADDSSADDQGADGQSQGHRKDGTQGKDTSHDADDQGQDDQGGDDQGQDDQGQDGDDQGEDGDDQGEDQQDGDEPTSPAVELPASWAGTYSAESMPAGNGYLIMQNLYLDQRGATSMDPTELLRTEFLASSGATCEGTATLEGDTALCHLADDGEGGGEKDAVVHIVPAAFDSTALLIEVEAENTLGIADAPQGIGALMADEPDQVTEEDAEGAMLTAVMMAESPEGPLPEELDVQCDVLDGGEHALCEITGTPDGGGDGTWYGTVQPGPGLMLLYGTQMPA